MFLRFRLLSFLLASKILLAASPVDPLTVLSMIPGFPSIWDLIQRQPAGSDADMERLTLAPIVRMNMTKTMLRDSRVANITADLDAIVNKAKAEFAKKKDIKTANQKIMKKVSFLQANPFYLRNSGDVTMPLRKPPQAYVNVAVRENVAGTRDAKLWDAEKKEIEFLRQANNKLMSDMLKKANITRLL